MVTTVGTGDSLPKIIENYLLLEHDAIAAYEAVIERLDSTVHKERISAFLDDHHRHVSELEELARRYNATIPTGGDMKQMLTTGKVKLANLVGGDGAILKAHATNEMETVMAYENGTRNSTIPSEIQPIFQAGLADERRHKAYMDEAAAQA